MERMKKKFAVVSLWDKACKRSCNIPNSSMGVEIYLKAKFFRTRKEAIQFFETAVQGQDEVGGEVDRFIVKIIR